MQRYDIIIIGGGPAGLFTAINASNKNKTIAILEKNKSCGKKLLMTGLGKCNITQSEDIFNFLNNYGNNARFLKYALLNYTNLDLLDFFRRRGLSFMITENNKIFPESENAQDILNVLVNECLKLKVDIIYNTSVTNIVNENNRFLIETQNIKFEATKVVVSTGGMSYPTTGSTGDGQRFAKSLGHKIVPLRPALTPVKIKDYTFTDLSGLSFNNISFSLWRDNKKIKTYQGDLLFTHTGLSGPVIINNSREIKNKDIIKINFINQSIEEFKRDFTNKLSCNGKLLVKTLVRGLSIPKRLADKLLTICNIDSNLKCAELKKDQRVQLLLVLTEYQMEIKELGDFNVAMVTAGGVSLNEINSQTMQSEIISGLYFVGEVIDIDGNTGGYNLQAAFSTAYIAAKDINKKI